MVSYRENDIAIIGISGRFPEADDLDAFWQNLAMGKDSVRAFPQGRVAELAQLVGEIQTDDFVRGGYLDTISYFEPEYFNISPEEARYIDPQQRLLLELVDEALNDGGYGGRLYGKKVGIFMAISKNNYSNLIDPGMPMALANIPESAMAGRVAYVFNFTGPTLTIDTACSSSLTAVHYACQAIRLGECEYAVAGGAKMMVIPSGRAVLGVLPILSKNEQARAFDKDADGTTFGEGGGVVLLKSLRKALEDGDSIHAIIKASAVNSDGGRSNGLAAPNQDAQAEVITDVLARAEVEADSISYIETHGTGTKLGDPIEVEGIARAFSRHTQRKQFIAISSLKTNIGHLDTAAGIGGLTKAVLAIKNKTLPPSLHYQAPNPHIDFVNSPVYVNDQLTEWKAQGVRRAGITSLGLTGTNVHMLIEEAPLLLEKENSSGNVPQIVTLSARTAESLQATVRNLCEHLARESAPTLDDIAFTLNTGRRQLAQRLAIVAASKDELMANLTELESKLGNDEEVLTGSAEKGMYLAINKEHASGKATTFSPVFIYGDLLAGDELNDEIPNTCHYLKEQYAACTRNDDSLNTQFFALQYAFSQLLTSLGIGPKAILGVGMGKCASDVVQGKTTLTAGLAQVKGSTTGQAMVDDNKLQNVINQMIKDGHNLFVVLEGQNHLGQRIQKLVADRPNVYTLTLDTRRDSLYRGLCELYLAGLTINWDGLYTGEKRRRVNLPTYAYNRQSYLIQPYALKSALRTAHTQLREMQGLTNSNSRTGSANANGIGSGRKNDTKSSVNGTVSSGNAREGATGSIGRKAIGDVPGSVISSTTGVPGNAIVNASDNTSYTRVNTADNSDAMLNEQGSADLPKPVDAEELLEMFRNVTGTTINLAEDFTANGADSIVIMQAVGLIKKQYEVSVPMDLFFTANSVQELVERLVVLINNSLMPEVEEVATITETTFSSVDNAIQTDNVTQLNIASSDETVRLNSIATGDETPPQDNFTSNGDIEALTNDDSGHFLKNHHIEPQRELPTLSEDDIEQLNVTVAEPGNILLTGATGFFGAHLIHDLINNTGARIYCPVRGDSTENAFERLKERLNYYFGTKLDQYLGERIIALQSDLLQPLLGLDEDNYNELAGQVETIIHSAADVRHQGKYAEFEKNNIFTTQQMLEFAFNSRKKVFHQVSTMAVAGWNAEMRRFGENNCFTGQTFQGNPYGRSKFEAEKLVYEARKHGLETSVYRVGNLVGRYSDGFFQPNIEQNEIYNYIKAVVILERLPTALREGRYEITPVDLCTEAMTKIILSKELRGYTYHLVSPVLVTFGQILDVLDKIGHHVAEVDFDNFYRHLNREMDSNEYVRELGLIFNNIRASNDRTQGAPHPLIVESDFTRNILAKTGFTWPELDSDFLERMLTYCDTVGYFPASGPKTVTEKLSRFLRRK